MTALRCAARSLSRGEPVLGTASTVTAYLLVEYAGAWGEDALRDSRLPEEVKTHLRETSRDLGIKVLLIRRHTRQREGTVVCRVFAAYAEPHSPWMETTSLGTHEDILDLDLAPLSRGCSLGLSPHLPPLFLSCTHGRHDTCCAERGRPVAKALASSHPDCSWEVSHIGGDRFAGNVLVLPDGLYYGRVESSTASQLAERHLAGALSLDMLRGRSGYPFAVQAAEWFLRTELDEPGLDALRMRHRERHGSDWDVGFEEVSGQGWQVRLRTGSRDPERLTCSAQRPNAAPMYELLGISAV